VGDYVITNVRYDDDNSTNLSSIQMQETTTKDGVFYDYKYFEGETTNEVKDYLSKYHNPIVYVNKHVGELVGLFSFLEKSNIEFFYWFDDDSLQNPFNEFYSNLNPKRNLKFENYNCVNQFCNFNGMSIKDELKDFTSDRHPGYFGSKLFAEKTIKMLENRLKPKLYVFGDSHTQTFRSFMESGWAGWVKPYVERIGEIPDNFSEIISKEYEIELVNLGRGGMSNYSIFDKFYQTYKSIKPNDIVVFGWTSINRFRLATNVNDFADILPFTPHPKQNDDVELTSTNEIAVNRETHSIWWSEVTQFIKIIKDLLPKNKILHWTWVDPELILPTRIWSQESIDLKHALYTHNWRYANQKIKDLVYKNCDYVVDLSVETKVEQYLELNKKGKKIFFCNNELSSPEIQDYINRNFSLKYFCSGNYKKECFDLFIPYRKYELIVDETNGEIQDKHLSRNGHKVLAKDLMDIIENIKPII
jgi:hypothetical protein